MNKKYLANCLLVCNIVFAMNVTAQLKQETKKIIAASRDEFFTIRDGYVFGWGSSTSLIGNSDVYGSKTPIQIGNNNQWQSIVCGKTGFTLAIRTDGTLWGWGKNKGGEYAGSGYLGLGTTENQPVPLQVGTEKTWVSLSSGVYHTIALKADGTIWAWGFNDKGQLGNSGTNDKSRPTQVGKENNWASIFTEGYTSFGIKTDGSLWGWGDNAVSQLGIPGNTQTAQPVPVQIGADKDWKYGNGGLSHCLAIKQDGSLWAWGYNWEGELGNGLRSTDNTQPIRVGNDKDWSGIAGGDDFSIAIKLDGSMWSWGKNDRGQLGIGNNNDQLIPVKVGKSKKWTAASSGSGGCIAVQSDGSVWVWGVNSLGQLGIGNRIDQNSPVQLNF